MYVHGILSINNPYVDNCLGQTYPAVREIKNTTESNTSASYLDLLLSIGRDGQLHTSFNDKREDFNFHSTSFEFHLLRPREFLSQFIRYARACSSYEYFILRAARLSSKFLSDMDMSGTAWNYMGISSNIMKSLYPKCYTTFWDMTVYSDTLNWSDITPICDLIAEFDLITKFREVSIENCNRCG